MELNQIRYFLKLSETLNFSRAAEELFITQPSLSAQINSLETELGIKLFERTTRKVELTEVGKRCLPSAKEIIRNIDDITYIVNKYVRENASQLRIGVLSILPKADILGVISQFQEENAQIHTELHFGWSKDIIDLLLKQELDVVISNIYSNHLMASKELDIMPFLSDQLVLVVSKKNPLANHKHISLSNLISERIWIVDPNSSVIMQFKEAIKKELLAEPELSEARSMRSVMKLVGSDYGVSVFSSEIAREYHTHEVKRVPIAPHITTTTAVVSLKSNAQQDSIKKLKEYFAAAFTA